MSAAAGVGLLCAFVAGAAVLGWAPPSRLPSRRAAVADIGVPISPGRLRGSRAFGIAVAVVVGGLVATDPVLGVMVGLGGVGLWFLRRRSEQRRREDAVVDQLPDVVDLLRLTTLAGLPVSAALGVVGARPGGPLGAAIERAASMIRYGASTADALASFRDETGSPTRGLVEALAEHVRYGSPLGPALDRVAIEARLRRRRRAEEAARRLPVTLLFPLVLTTMPSLILLTVIPILAASLSSLPA